jgi:hypothetical protein
VGCLSLSLKSNSFAFYFLLLLQLNQPRLVLEKRDQHLTNEPTSQPTNQQLRWIGCGCGLGVCVCFCVKCVCLCVCGGGGSLVCVIVWPHGVCFGVLLLLGQSMGCLFVCFVDVISFVGILGRRT